MNGAEFNERARLIGKKFGVGDNPLTPDEVERLHRLTQKARAHFRRQVEPEIKALALMRRQLETGKSPTPEDL